MSEVWPIQRLAHLLRVDAKSMKTGMIGFIQINAVTENAIRKSILTKT
jgi:hypothetical protein